MTRHYSTFTFLLLLTFPAAVLGQPRIRRFNYYSESVHDTMHIVVLLPTQYKPRHTYPVLFLLHGYGGDQDDWTSKTDIVSYTAAMQVIVVMPEAKNSWYVNSRSDAEQGTRST